MTINSENISLVLIKQYLIYSFVGNAEFDNVLTVLLSTAMFVGGFTGFILDNIIPGKVTVRFVSLFYMWI